MTVENSLRPFQLKVVKVNDKNTPLKGAEFTLYSDRECRNEIVRQFLTKKENYSLMG